ncbi:hypothetical protein FRX31_013209, partial [Thalictrum thalictroides]
YIDLAADLKKFDKFPWGTVVYDCLADSLEIVYKYIDLATDLKKFDKFPWGTVVYDCLADSLETVYKKETTISKLLDNKKRKKPEKDYLYYPRKPTTEEKTIEVVQEAIEWMKELEADAVSESFTSIPSSSSTHGNFDVEGLKNIIGLISSAVDVERIAEELGKKFEIVPKKSSPKKKNKATHKTNKNASTKATPVAKKRKMTPAQKKAMEHDEDEEDIEPLQNEEEMVHVQHEDEKEHDEVLKAVPTKRKRTQTIAVERRNQPYRETKGKDHSWKKVLTKKPRMGKTKADMLSHPEDIMRDPVKHKPTYSTDDENMEDVDPEKEYLVTMEKLTVITKLDLKRTGEESSKSLRKDCPSSSSEVQDAGDFIMSSRLPDKKVAVDTDEKLDDDEEDVVDDKVLELFNSDSEDVIKRGAVEDEIEVLIAKEAEKEVDPLFIPIQRKREIERKTIETRRRKLLDHLDLMVGRDCDQQIKLTMTDAICKRTTTNEQSSWLDQVWKFGKNNLGYLSKTLRYYGYGTYLPYRDFCTLNEEEWLNDFVIDVYMKLLTRWYTTETEDLADDDRYSIVTSVFFATKCHGPIQDKFDALMKMKDFKKAEPKKRFEMGFSLCNSWTYYVDIFDGLRCQPHPTTAKALLVPLQVIILMAF